MQPNRGYVPINQGPLFDDDPGIMSEVETASTGFRRGGKQRSSLPVVRTPSKTLERPLGMVSHTQSYFRISTKINKLRIRSISVYAQVWFSCNIVRRQRELYCQMKLLRLTLYELYLYVRFLAS